MPEGQRSKIDPYFQSYAAYHRTRGNQLCHSFGIPMITISVFGILGLIGQGPLNAGLLLWAGSLLWLLTLDWKLALPFGAVTFGMYLLGHTTPLPANLILFTLGWVIQFVGHSVYEKNRPAFFENMRQLVIGPFWIFAKFVGHR